MNEHYKFVNVPLPFEYDALEPFIDAKTMELHHSAHLQTYIDNLNKALENRPELQELSLEELIEVDEPAIKNNAGGVFNHFFFFEQLGMGSKPHGRLEEEINKRFGSFEGFVSEMSQAALSVFGSGYAWLVVTPNGLELAITPNQTVAIEQDVLPLLNFDVWEHAYYLKHFNKRANYVANLFNVINYKVVSARLEDALQELNNPNSN